MWRQPYENDGSFAADSQQYELTEILTLYRKTELFWRVQAWNGEAQTKMETQSKKKQASEMRNAEGGLLSGGAAPVLAAKDSQLRPERHGFSMIRSLIVNALKDNGLD